MGKNPILVGFAVVIVAVVVGAFIVPSLMVTPPADVPEPEQAASSPIPDTPTPEPPPPTPTPEVEAKPVAPPTATSPPPEVAPVEDTEFAPGWTYLSLIGDVVDMDFGNGVSRPVRLNEPFTSPEEIEAKVVELRPHDNMVIVERVSDGKRAEVPKAAAKGPKVLLYYAFDQPGDTILDVSSGRNGTAHGTTFVENGRRGGARSFDGKDDYIDVPVEGLELSGPLTVCLWLRGEGPGPNLEEEWGRLIQLGDPSGQTPGFGITTGNRNGKILGFYQEKYTEKEYAVRTAIPLSNRMWHHIAMVYDGSTAVRIFVNGTPVNEEAPPEDRGMQAGPGRNLNIGKRAGEDSYYFSGQIDELFIFPEALSPDEIQRVYRLEY